VGTYVWMRVLESAPRRYDFGVRLLSLGHIETIYEKVTQRARGPEVLDLGCGTGTLAVRMAARGLRVTGVDLSPEMLALARRRAPPQPGLRWVETSAVELIDHFQKESFDTICCVLLLSELSAAERREALRQCRLLLRAAGQLIVADEVRAPTLARRFLHNLVRLPLAMITYALTQTTTSPVPDLETELAAARFAVVSRESNRLGTFLLLEARKQGEGDAPAG
jgi:ubiquinone/menaquinone biosynthesis C-methylase UbiE